MGLSSVVKHIRRSLDVHLKNYFKVIRCYGLRFSGAQHCARVILGPNGHRLVGSRRAPTYMMQTVYSSATKASDAVYLYFTDVLGLAAVQIDSALSASFRHEGTTHERMDALIAGMVDTGLVDFAR